MDDIIISIVLSGEHSTLHLIEYIRRAPTSYFSHTRISCSAATLQTAAQYKTKNQFKFIIFFFVLFCSSPLLKNGCRRYLQYLCYLLSPLLFCLIINFCCHCFRNSLPICTFCFVMCMHYGSSSQYSNSQTSNLKTSQLHIL